MIGIHNSGNDFSQEWIAYCEKNNIAYKVVNVYSNNIIADLEDCGSFMWHHNHSNPKDVLFSKELLTSLRMKGLKTFPDYNSSWHFDDKLAQKYLFESLEIDHAKTYVFYDKEGALNWTKSAHYPVVAKLRRGASSGNVRLISSERSYRRYVTKLFGRGIRLYNYRSGIKDALTRFIEARGSFKELLKAFAHVIYPIKLEKSLGRESGYVLFQEFVPGNDYDIRVIVVNQNKAFAIKRNVRKGDFRASGSGYIQYEKSNFDESLIRKAFQYSRVVNASCLAFDFIFDNNVPLVVEISYGFSKKAYFKCPGYWDAELNWYEGEFNPYGWMVDNVLEG